MLKEDGLMAKLTVIENETDECYVEIIVNKNFLNTFFIYLMLIKSSNENIRKRLTKREKEVLIETAKGSNNKEIGKKLYMSSHTAKMHLSHIYEKLEVSDRTEAVSKAIKLKIIDVNFDTD